MRLPDLIGPLLLGVATGCRSTLGVAGVSFGDQRRAGPRPIQLLQSRRGQVTSATLVVAELVGDKLPSAPSRLDPKALVPRLVFGAAGGGALAWRDGTSRPGAVTAGLAGAALGSWAGARFRALVRQRDLPDLPAALAEDAAALAMARAAGRTRG